MSTINREILKECLIKSTLKEIEEIESLDYSHIRADEMLKERIRSSIARDKVREGKKRITPKRVLVALIAAVLLSLAVMFTVSAEIRGAVSDFFVEIYATFSEFITNKGEEDTSEDYPEAIEKVYYPKYISENDYFEIDKTASINNVFTVWTNGEAIIDLSQRPVSDRDTIIDTENAEYGEVYVGDYTVFYALKNNLYQVAWVAHGYYFSMSCDEILGWEAVEQIILSLEPVE